MAKQLFQNATEFSQTIEEMAVNENISYVDCLLKFCDENDLEPDEIASSVGKSLRDKLEVEFAEMGMLQKLSSLYD